MLPPARRIRGRGGGFWGRPLAGDQDLAAFIAANIRSVWTLEQLLALYRAPERVWTTDDLVRELRSTASIVEANGEIFLRAGLIAPQEGGGVRFAPASPALARLCADLDALYRERPVSVINAIANPVDRLQALADAFKLKKRDGE